MKKMQMVFLVIIILIALCIYVNNTLNEYTDEINIDNKIGEKFSGGSLTYKEFLILAENTVGAYYKHLQEKKYEDAYDLLTPEYKRYIPSGEYIAKMESEEIESFVVEDIVQKTEYLYEAYLKINNEKSETLLIVLKNNEFAVAPGEFIKQEIVNEEIKKSGVTYTLNSYEMELYKCTFTINVTNENDKEVELSRITMINDQGGKTNYKGDIPKINANSTVELKLEFETMIDFPAKIEIGRQNGENEKVYTFEL